MYRNCKSGTTGLASELDQLGTRVTASASNVSLVWSQEMGCDMLTLLFKKAKIGNSRDMNNLRWSIEESLFHALKVAGLIPR